MNRKWVVVVAAAVGVSACALGVPAQDFQSAGQSSAPAAAAQESQSTGQGTEKSRPVEPSGAQTARSTQWYNPKTWPNPIRWIRKGSRTPSEQLAANGELEKKLTAQLQRMGLLPAGTDLKNTCSAFRSLEDCVAAIHASHTLGLEFDCLKFDVTGVYVSSGKSSCAGPPGGRSISLAKAIALLKPEADARAEERNAQRQARADISDASS